MIDEEKIINKLRKIIICDYDLFVNKNTIEIIFTKSMTTKKLFNIITNKLKDEANELKIIKHNASSFVITIDKYTVIFKKSSYI